MRLGDLVSKGMGNLNERQLCNVEKLLKISKNFHRKAKIDYDPVDVEDTSIVVEAAHQPNFLPYSGVWKKVFLLDYIQKLNKIIPIFGFFDYNLCTSNWLFRNRVPDIKKVGMTVIGFKIDDRDRWKRFNSIDKPSKDDLKKVIDDIVEIYSKVKNFATLDILDVIADELWKSYKLGKNMADVNAIFFARLSKLYFNFNVFFFKYSDMHEIGILKEEHRLIINDTYKFNKIYNEIAMRLDGIDEIPNDLLPVWYHCDCGGKVPMHLRSNVMLGSCPICKRDFEISIEEFDEIYQNVSPRAVTRNVVTAEGFGTTFYISGPGGGLKYGTIAKEISKRFGLSLPTTIVWTGRDYYIGPMHRLIVRRLKKIYGIENLLDVDEWLRKIDLKRRGIEEQIKEKFRGHIDEYKRAITQIKIAGSIFNLTPSILDLMISEGFDRIVKCWRNTISNAKVSFEDWFYRIGGDVSYDLKSKEIYRIVEILNAIK